MKMNNQSFEHSFECEPLSVNDLIAIDGGGLWGDISYLCGATLRCIREFTKIAAEYQCSLPANLKK